MSSNSNNNNDEEKMAPSAAPEQPRPVKEVSARCSKLRICLGLAVILIASLVVGLSVGLTRPDSKDTDSVGSSNNTPEDGEEPTTGTPGNGLESAPKFVSMGKTFDVSMNLLSNEVLTGYSSAAELRDDLTQTVRFFVNNFIEDQLRYNQRYPQQPSVPEIEDTTFIADEADGQSSPSGAGVTDFETNNQEEGVDQADLVKSDGTHVYVAYDDVLVVWEALTGTYITNYTLPTVAKPAKGGKGDPNMEFTDFGYYNPHAYIRGISLESARLVLYVEGYGPEVKEALGGKFACYDAFATRIIVLDASVLPLLTVLTQKDIQGSYRDARCIGSNCHVVSSCNFDLWSVTKDIDIWQLPDLNETEYRTQAAAIVEPSIASYVDLMYEAITTHVGEGEIPNMPKISLWQSTLGTNEDVVAQVNKAGAIQAFLGLISFDPTAAANGDLELGSAGVCTPSSWGFTTAINTPDSDDGTLMFAAQGWDYIPELGGTGQTTYLMGFGLDGTSAKPALLGSTPGYVQSERAIGIYDGHVRVATTIDTWWVDMEDDVMQTEPDDGIGEGAEPLPGDVEPTVSDKPSIWPQPRNIVQNQVIILKIPDMAGKVLLEEVTRISDLGEEGERIKAVRYFGPIGYAVTFLQTDPFYVLDLNPGSAKILGELKITGFSAYLHSINEANTLLIGVGQEADEFGNTLGIKVSLFDASVPTNPTLVHSATVEEEKDTWSSSEVLFDFLAFRYVPLGPEVGIVIIPVRVESMNQEKTGNFDGFYVYDVSLDGGIVLRTTISHVESEAFYGCYSSARLPQRSMVFNGNVTTLKGHSVVSTDLDTGSTTWMFELDQPTDDNIFDGCVFW